MNLFEVAAITTASEKEKEEGKQPELVFGPVCVVAKDAQTAVMKVVSEGNIPEGTDLNKIQVMVRPF